MGQGRLLGVTMNFRQSYRFFDLHDVRVPRGKQRIEDTRSDFVKNFGDLLTLKFKVPSHSADAVAEAVFRRMSDRTLHYHTPVHVLAIFQWWQEFIADKFPLTDLQQLAIWFHDAVYCPTAEKSMNERQSALFLRSMMTPYLNINQLQQVESMIEATALHESERTLPEEHNSILDLDLCNFLWSKEEQEQVTRAIAKEYEIPLDVFFKGRQAFLTMLISKGFLYRTEFFQKKFEAQAMRSIKEMIGGEQGKEIT
jgi:predicted metal-dependent HD superfamily phosphohydrolase